MTDSTVSARGAALIVPRDPATRLRLATEADAPFRRRLFDAERAGVFAAAGLPQAALDRLLEQQFQAQASGYAARFPDAVSLIVLDREEPVGHLMLQSGLHSGDQSWRIVDIVLLPAARGRGIGTDLIEAVLRAAAADGAREVALSVLADNNAARRLYGRLGFVQTGEGVHIPMAVYL